MVPPWRMTSFVVITSEIDIARAPPDQCRNVILRPSCQRPTACFPAVGQAPQVLARVAAPGRRRRLVAYLTPLSSTSRHRRRLCALRERRAPPRGGFDGRDRQEEGKALLSPRQA